MHEVKIAISYQLFLNRLRTTGMDFFAKITVLMSGLSVWHEQGGELIGDEDDFINEIVLVLTCME